MVLNILDMSRPEFEEYLKREKHPVAIVPVASIEQHALHLPLGTDWLVAYHFAVDLAEKTNSLLVPVVMAGVSPHHMHFKGTITLSQETFVRVLSDVVESLVSHGVRKIVLLNGHGGNNETCEYFQVMVGRKPDVEVLYMGPTPRGADKLIESYDWHSGPSEVAALHLYRPDLIHMERWVRPTLKWTPMQQKLIEEQVGEAAKRHEVIGYWFRTKMKWTDDVTDTGQFGYLPPGDIVNDPAKMEEYRKLTEKHLEECAELINQWRRD